MSPLVRGTSISMTDRAARRFCDRLVELVGEVPPLLRTDMAVDPETGQVVLVEAEDDPPPQGDLEAMLRELAA